MDQILKLKLHQSGEILPLDENQAITAQELEDGATALRLYLEAAGTLRDHFIEVIKPNGSKMASARLVEETDSDGAYVEIVLGGTLLDMPGRYAIQYCGYVGSEKAVKSRLAFISVKGSINALEGIGVETLDFIQYINGVIQDVAAEIVSRNLAFLGTNTHQGSETFKWFTVTNALTGGKQEQGHYRAAQILGEWLIEEGPIYFGGADGEIATLNRDGKYSEWYSPDGYYWGIDGPFGLDIAIIKRGLANTSDALFKLPDIDCPEPCENYSGSTPVPYTLDYQERVNALVTTIQGLLQAAIDTKAPAGTTYTKTEVDELLNGKADLQNGKVPVSQTPSSLDDFRVMDMSVSTRGIVLNPEDLGSWFYYNGNTRFNMAMDWDTFAAKVGQDVAEELKNKVFVVLIPYGDTFASTLKRVHAYFAYRIYEGGTSYKLAVIDEPGDDVRRILESNTVYLDPNTNKQYRWTGSPAAVHLPTDYYKADYVSLAVVSDSLAIGETASTAFAGNRGKALETHAGETDAALSDQSNRIAALEEAIVQPFELLGLGDGEYTFTTSSRLRQVADGEYVIITA